MIGTTLDYVDAIRTATEAAGDHAAVLFEGQATSWSRLLDNAARLAGAMRDLGVKPGDRVAILSANSRHYIELYLAIPWVGGVIAPLNSRWSVAENAFALADCEPRLLISGTGFGSAARAACLQAGLSIPIISEEQLDQETIAYDQLLAHPPLAYVSRGGNALWGIFYTGGTSGRPKGVMLSGANVISNSQTVRSLGLFPSGCRSLIATPLFHLAASSALLSTMLAGGTAVVTGAFDPGETLRVVSQEHVTDMFLVPSMIRMLLDDSRFHARMLSGVQSVLYGASPMPEQLLDRIAAAAPQARLFQAYGMTELSPAATVLGPAMHVGADRLAGRHRSAGRAIPGVEVMIADPAGAPVPQGQVGEVLVRGPGVMQGYWNQAELTDETLRGGWMHTGDGGRVDETGALYIVDRIKDMIVSGGENVYSGEVESALDSHPDVLQCAVIAVPDERWGERVHAVVVLRTDAAEDQDALKAHCRRRIADYKCPRSFDFVDALPMSAAGKVLKTELRKAYWQGRPSHVA